MERKEKHEEERVSKNTSPTKEEEKTKTKIIDKSNDNHSILLPNPQEEFAFGFSGSEMCAADDVFFRGKILPFQPRSANQPKPATAQLAPRQQRARNRFHTHPSPKPRVTFERASSGRVIKQKASLWDFFKVGLVRTPPELESQEPKNLRSNSRSRAGRGVSRSSSGSNSDNTKTPTTTTTKMKLLSGCACSADSVVSDSIVNSLIVTKLEEVLLLEKSSGGTRSDDDCYYYYNYNYYKDDDDRKPKKHYSKDYQGVMRSRKQAESNHRTYEWLKQLSRANIPPMLV